jgi:hypothetical protein
MREVLVDAGLVERDRLTNGVFNTPLWISRFQVLLCHHLTEPAFGAFAQFGGPACSGR